VTKVLRPRLQFFDASNSNWPNVFYMVLLILLVVFIFDSISNVLRSRLIGRTS